MGSRLVGLSMKGVLTDESLTLSRNWERGWGMMKLSFLEGHVFTMVQNCTYAMISYWRQKSIMEVRNNRIHSQGVGSLDA